MRTELSRRIGGEIVAVRVTIGVMEAAAEIHPEWVRMLGALQLGHHALTRRVIVEGARAAGRPGDADAWFDALAERAGLAPLSLLAFDAMSDAFAKAADVTKNPAAETTTTEATGAS